MLVALSAALLCSRPARAEDRLTLAVASSLRVAAAEVVPALQQRLSVRVELASGASSLLARQIRAGAPIDLLIAADEETPDSLIREGLAVAESRAPLFGNTLVAVVPAGSTFWPREPEQLLSPALKRIAFPDQAVPLGHYARQWLAAQGLLAQLGDRWVRTADAGATLAAAASGSVDLAFVYATDARLEPKRVRVAFQVPASQGPPIRCVAVVLRGPRQALAQQALAQLRGAALAPFARAGFTLLR